MDEWNPKLAWLIGGCALLATAAILFFAWPAAKPQIDQALQASRAPAPEEAAGGGAAPAITENRTVGDSRVHRID
jgi:uncharacterized iron-regulated membrane protein